MTITVRYWAGARAAAGVDTEEYDFVEGLTLAAVLDAVRVRHDASHPDLARVLARSSYLVDEISPGREAPESVAIPSGAVVEVLPAFAGG